jgi:hypothetical protein
LGEDIQMLSSLLLSILLLQGVAPVKGGTVAGTLRGTDGRPAAGVRVGVMDVPGAGRGGRGRGAGTLVSQAKADDSGRFQLEDVPPGHYYIVAGTSLFVPTFYPGVLEVSAAKLIEVRPGATVRNIDFDVFEVISVSTPDGTAAPVVGIGVSGRIVLKNSPDAPMPRYLTFQASPAAGVPGRAMMQAVARDGKFVAILPLGDHRLSDIHLPEGYSVASMTSGGTDVLTQPLSVKPGVELIVTLDVGDIQTRYRLLALVLEDSTDRLLAGEPVELVHPSGEVVRLTVNAQGMVTFPELLRATYILRLASAGFDVPEKQVVITDGSVQVELRARRK